LLGGEPLRSIAQRTGLSHSSICRHKLNCLPQDLIQARLSKKILDADFLLAKASKILRAAELVLEKSEQSNNSALVLAAARELRAILELLAKFTNQPGSSTQMDLHLTAEFSTLRSTVLSALEPFPDARIAVAAAFSRTNENSE
jgi:hypothetical protein